MLFKIIEFDRVEYKINTKFLTPLFLIKKSIFKWEAQYLLTKNYLHSKKRTKNFHKNLHNQTRPTTI